MRDWFEIINDLVGGGKKSVDELVDMGYPEHTARKIESGELDMTPEGQRKRAMEQSFDPRTIQLHGTSGEDIREWDPEKLQSRDFGWVGKGVYTSEQPSIAEYYARTSANRTGLEPNVMELYTATDAMGVPLATKNKIGKGMANEQEARKAAAQLQIDAERLGYSGIDVKLPNGDNLERANFDPSNVRSRYAAFDPENRNKNYVFGFDGKGGAAALGGGAVGAIPNIEDKFVSEDFGDTTSGTEPPNFDALLDIPAEIWESMPLRDKVALVTSVIPVVGTATGVYADVMNMVENPDERTLLNTAMLASNFIPANKVADLVTKMGITDLYGKTGLGKAATKKEVEAKADPRFGEVAQVQKKGEVVEQKPYETRSSAGYIDNPLLSELRAGTYGDQVSDSIANKMMKRADQDPRFEELNLARDKGSRTVSEDNLYAQQANWEQMIGSPILILPADRTSIRRVDRIGGVDIEPFHTQGGGAHAAHQQKWRSEAGAAEGKQLHINKVRKETGGKDPIAIYTPMQHAGSNFSTMTSEGVLHYLDAIGDLSPEGRKALDRKMGSLLDKGDTKGVARAYEGYENPEQMLYWLTNPEALKEGTPSLGNRRKGFINVMDSEEMRRHGAPFMSDVYTAINEPSLINLPHGMAGGYALRTTDAGHKGLPYDPTAHRSYSTDIPAAGALQINDDYVPLNVLFPDMAAARADKSPAQRYRSMQTAGSGTDYQMADEQWFEGINRWKEEQKRRK
jgi:hypothetical protein